MKIVVKNKFLFIFIILFMIFSIISYSFSNVKNVENYYVESNQNLKLEDNVTSTKLSSLSIKNYESSITFSPDTLEYNIQIFTNTYTLDVDAVPQDANAKVTINGNYYIINNTGTVTITVSNGIEADTTYTINYEKRLTSVVYNSFSAKTSTLFTVPSTGTYLLEVWGARAGNRSGYGGYTRAYADFKAGFNLYVTVGGQGAYSGDNASESSYRDNAGGYNGGGNARCYCGCSAGGGASHIASLQGEIQNLSGYKNKFYIVAGGSGGGYYWKRAQGTGYSAGTYMYYGSFASSFGKGGTGTGNKCGGGGGGGGWYAGAGGGNTGVGSGGSGYVNPALTYNAAMYCYNCGNYNGSGHIGYSTTATSSGYDTNKISTAGNGGGKITKVLPYSENDYLATLTTNTGEWDKEFNPAVFEYKIIVPMYQTSVDIIATASDSDAVISNDGLHDLDTGYNEIEIMVVAPSGSTRFYKLNVLREGSKNTKSSEVASFFNIKGAEMILTSPGVYVYDVHISSNNMSVPLEVKTYSNTATYTITGNDFVLEGDTITVEVSDREVANSTYYLKVLYTDSKIKYEYSSTGNYQTFVAPTTADYLIELWGASGGTGYYSTQPVPGRGAYTKGMIHLDKGTSLYVYVGGKGENSSYGYSRPKGGYNGGGSGSTDNTGGDSGGAGGGATDVRLVNGSWDDVTSLASRIMVAAGGGGTHSTNTTNYREGTDAGALQVAGNISTWQGTFTPTINQTTGYLFGKGINGTDWYCHSQAGGGGGYYGGSAYVDSGNCSGRASGGSSYISGYTGAVAVKSELDTSPKDGCTTGTTDIECSYHYSGYIFKEPEMASGGSTMPSFDGTSTMTGNTSSGYAKISIPSLSENNFLRNITTDIGDWNIEYNSRIQEYTVTVSAYADSVIIQAEKYEDKQTLTGTGLKELEIGNNEFPIEVTAESGDIRVYTINVYRQTIEPSSLLYKMKLGNDVLNCEEDVYDYQINISNNQYSLDVKGFPFDPNATITYSGFGYIKQSKTAYIIVNRSGADPEQTVYSIEIVKDDISDEVEFNYTGAVQTFTAKEDGYYLLESWGAQGGSSGGTGGYGAYSSGLVHLNKDDVLYIYVGGAGGASSVDSSERAYYYSNPGYNGGGKSYCACGCGSGGGATHIALNSNRGVLSNYTNNKDEVLIVAGGGGGAFYWKYGAQNGSSGGGYTYIGPAGGRQSSGTFGQGGAGAGNKCGGGAGGGGWTGGTGGANCGSGSGGLSYIASNSLESLGDYTKHMTCYNCPTTTTASQLTKTTTKVSSNAVSDYAKSGNGAAKVTYINFNSDNFLKTLKVSDVTKTNNPSILINKAATEEVPIDENINYTAATTVTSVKFEGKPVESTSTVNGNGTYLVPAGHNSYLLKVTAENQSVRDYTINIDRDADTNIYPDNIEINGLVLSLCNQDENYCLLKTGSLDGATITFDKNTNEYYMTVPSRIKQIKFNVIKGHYYQVVTGDGIQDLTKSTTGTTDITIDVMSEYCAINELTDSSCYSRYTYHVTRDTASDTDIRNMFIDNKNTTGEFTIDPTSDENLTFNFSYENPDVYDYYFSVPNEWTNLKYFYYEKDADGQEIEVVGNETGAFSEAGRTYLVQVIVTAPNKVDTAIYRLHVYRELNSNIYLSSLSVTNSDITYPLNMEFTKSAFDYEVTIPYEISEVDINYLTEVNTTTALMTSSKGTISGKKLFNIPTGKTEIVITTTSEISLTGVYTITLTREYNDDSSLSNLVVKTNDIVWTLDPTFDSNIFDYETTVDEGITTVDIIPTVSDSVTPSIYKLLDNNSVVVGNNLKRILVTAEDQSYSTYTVNIVRPASTDGTLKTLTVTGSDSNLYGVTLESDTFNYTIDVPNEVTFVNITAEKNFNFATLSGTGKYFLQTGDNTVQLLIVAEDGSIQNYNLTIRRAYSSNAKLSSISGSGTITPIFNEEDTVNTSYTINVPYTTTKMNLIYTPSVATTNVTAKDLNDNTLNGKRYNNSYTLPMNLVSGDNKVKLITLAEDQTTTITYNVNVVKEESYDTSLKTLRLKETKLIAGENDTYTAKLPYNVDPAHLIVEVNDSNSDYMVEVPLGLTFDKKTGSISGLLNETDENKEYEILVTVTAEDGTSKVYTIELTVQAYGNASNYLISLKLDKGTLNPSFDKDTMYYEVEVENNITSINVSGTLEDEDATVTGFGVYNNLAVGENEIDITVTASDGLERIYQLIVTRKPSSDATLSQLSINEGSLNPAFSSNVTIYTTSVDNNHIDFSSLVTTSNKATYEIINNEAGTIINTGDTALVTIKVTAEDKVTTKEYNITVTKAPSGNNNLSSLSVVGYTLTPVFNKNTTIYRTTVENNVSTVLVEATSEDIGATISGIGAVTLVTGENNISVDVTSESGVTKSYLLVITREYSDNANLEFLSINNGSLNKTFDKTTQEYDVFVDYSVNKLDLNYSPEYSNATVSVVGNEITGITKTVQLVVTAEDKTTTKIYTLNVTKDLTHNALLKDLSESSYEFTSDFNTYVFNYTMVVNYETTSLDLIAIPINVNSDINISGNSGFVVGENTVTITVTAEDNTTTQDYVIKVTRNKEINNYLDYLFNDYGNGDFNETFNKTRLKYSLTVSSDTESIILYGEKQSRDSIVTFNAKSRIVDESLVSESYLGTFGLEKGNNKIKINVTNQGYTRTYIINVTRELNSDKELLSLIVRGNNKRLTLTPEFEVGRTDPYSLTVDKDMNVIELSGEVSPLATVTGLGDVYLNPGLNTILITVTAEDGSTKLVTLNVTKEASDNANLIDLVPSNGTLSPPFGYELTSYNLELDSSVLTLSFDATLEDANATVIGLESEAVPDGESTRKITITAEDGITTKEYTINVKKIISTNAELLNLKVKDYDFIDSTDEKTIVEFNKDVFEYYVIVDNSKLALSSSDLIVTKSDSKSKVTYSDLINLSTKSYTEFAVIVTAEDGVTKNTYKINVKRKLGNDSSILSVSPEIGYLETAFLYNDYNYVWKVPVGKQVSFEKLGLRLKDDNATYVTSISDNTLSVVVTSEDGTSVSTYNFVGEYDYSTNLLAKTLRVFDSNDEYPYEPELNDETFEYTAHVYENLEKVNITMTPQAELATVLYDGSPVEVVEVLLPDETNIFTFTVLGEDGVSEQLYNIIIKKDILIEKNISYLRIVDENEICGQKLCKLNPTFTSDNTVYKVTVPYEYEKINLEAGLNAQQSIKYFIYENDDFVEIENGNYDLEFGATNIYAFVYDMLGHQTRTYRLTVTRNKSTNTKLNSLVIKNGSSVYPFEDIDGNPIEFSNDNNEYYITVPYNIEEVDVDYVKNEDSQKVKTNGYNYFTEGDTNDISVKVTAPDNKTIRTIIIHAYRESQYEIYLEGITVSSGYIWSLSPSFDKRKTSYIVNVTNGTEYVKVEGFVDSETTVSEAVTSLIDTGTNDFELIASRIIDGEVRTKTYTVTVIRPIASEVYLSYLKVSSNIDGEYTTFKNELGDTITFDRGTTDYYLEVSPGVTSLNINATPGQEVWNVNVYGNNLAPNSRNIISIIVYNEEYTTSRTYQLVVKVKPSKDASITKVTVEDDEEIYGVSDENFVLVLDKTYSVNVPYNVEKVNVSVTPAVDSATIEGNGLYYLEYGNNVVTITVIAEDGITTENYTVNIFRTYDLFLSAINEDNEESDINEDFLKTEVNYTMDIENDVEEIKIEGIPEENNVTVSYTLDENSAEDANIIDGILYTGVGVNKVLITVTAPDNTYKIYHLDITRKASDNNYLEALDFNEGNLNEPFVKTDNNYTMYVLDTYTSLSYDNKTDILTEDPNASYTVSGLSPLSSTNPNTVTITVTSQSGKTNIYTVTVVLKPDAWFRHYLQLLELSYTSTGSDNVQVTNYATLSPTFVKEKMSYTATVPYGVSSITVTTQTYSEDDEAIISASTESTTSVAFGTYLLNLGRNVINIKVHSKLLNNDGSYAIYKVIVYRNKNPEAELQSLAVRDYLISPSFASKVTNYYINITSEVTKLDITAIPKDPNAKVTILGNGPFSEGNNIITIKVVAADGITSKEYKINANCTLSNNNYLMSLDVKDHLITPEFVKTNTGVYLTNVDNDTTTVFLTAIKEDPSATLTITQGTNIYSKESNSLKLNPGNNYIYISVNSAAGNTRTYTLNIFRSYSTDNTLKTLVISDGVLIPSFDPEVVNYTVTLEDNLALLDRVSIIGIKNDVNAIVRGNGEYNLNDSGTTKVEIEVTAQSGDKRVYTVNFVKKEAPSSKLKFLEVNEGELVPEFNKDGYKYYVTVPNEISYLDLEIGKNVIPEDSEASVTISGNEKFKVGINVVNIKVTATNNDYKNYYIYVTRSILASNYLSDLYVDDYEIEPTFTSDNLNYELTVGSNVETIHVYGEKEDSSSTLVINGVEVNDKIVNLKYGINKIYFTVTSDNGASRTYTLKVTRSDSDEYYLLTLTTNLGTWDKVFDKDSNGLYTINVPAKTSMIEFSGTYSIGSTIEGLGNVQVSLGDNNHNITVTSPSGNKNIYTFKIIRPGSNNTKFTITSDRGDLTLEDNVYKLNVDDSVSQITFIVTPEDSEAKVVMDNSYNLSYGKNEITIKVIAEDGTEKEICIEIYRYKDIESIDYEEDEIILNIEQTSTPTYLINPENTDYKNVRFRSDDESIATVDSTGKITAISEGITYVYVISEHNDKIYDWIKVNVASTKISSDIYDVWHLGESENNLASVDFSYVIGIDDKTTIEDFVKNFNNNPEYLYVYSNDEEKQNITAYVGTGMKLKLKINDIEYDEVVIVVRGDNGTVEKPGNGIITSTDYATLSSILAGLTLKTPITSLLYDLNKNKILTVTDLSPMSLYIAGKATFTNLNGL